MNDSIKKRTDDLETKVKNGTFFNGKGWRWIDLVMRLAIPFLVAFGAWHVAFDYRQEARLDVIEATRVDRHQHFRDMIMELRGSIQALRDRIDRLERTRAGVPQK